MTDSPYRAMSSTLGHRDSEYMAIAHVACQGMWVRRLLQDLGVDYYADVSTPLLFTLRRTHAITRTRSTSHHFVREQAEDTTFDSTHPFVRNAC